MHTDLSENLEISDDECDLGEQTCTDNVRRVVPLKVLAMPIRPILRRDKSVSFYLPETAP